MHHSKILELLHTAHQRFSSIRVKWTYRGNEEIQNKMSANHNIISSLQRRRIYDESKKINKENWSQTWTEIWWQKPCQFRKESGNNRHKTEHLGTPVNFNSEQVSIISPTIFPHNSDTTSFLEEEIYKCSIIYPSFLLASHDFQFVKSTSHLNRDAILVYAMHRREVDVRIHQAFLWQQPYQYEITIDVERGILLEYSLKKDEQIVAIASVEDIAFDESFPDTLFFV